MGPDAIEPMPCRHCDGSLVERLSGGRSNWMCEGCGSTLVEQRDLVPVLTSAAESLIGIVDFDTEILPAPKGPSKLPCPDCDGPMTQFGYLGTNTAFPSRCGDCSLMWMEPEVFAAMTLLIARTTFRQAQRIAEIEADQEERNRRVSALLMYRSRDI